ncbi:PqiC family protein [Uliginosibacterium aquaticum]|uniref:Membrane integrity-associated transporter subunit PqiC n=1 Tax=Uliginosibacterium aquaticum TaxID=2731212 RepID=A0ABX2IAX1_9RHOO|nr:PqiC family protein [Uliginosibacterium aquaticum]NSL53525.1 membrane integrity-associated transporter subunit PqiC [Uliginosibacterium aquaticum]
MKRPAILILVSLLLAACSASPPQPLQLYQLSPQGAVQAGASLPVAVGLGPMKWPDYLTRRGLITRLDDNRLEVADSERWAEPLEAAFERVLRDNLVRRSSPSRLLAWPWSLTEAPAIQVPLEVLQFDASAQGEVVLRVRWRIVSREKQALAAERSSEYRVKVAGRGATASVAAHSEALARLSEDIAGALQTMRP